MLTYFFLIFLFREIYSFDLDIKEEECTIPVCNTTGPNKPACEEEKLVEFLADIQIINPESIVEWAVDNLEPLCSKISSDLKNIDNYLACCNSSNDDDLYMSLIAGVRSLKEKMCRDHEFAKSYVVYYPCLHELKNDFEACNGPADWNEDEDKNEMCKDYKDIVDCYYIKAAKVCGLDAANDLKELMKAVINSVIKIKCSGINRNPYVADPMPATYIKRCSNAGTIQISIKAMIIMLLMLYNMS